MVKFVEKLIVDIDFMYTTIKITNEFKNVSVMVGVVEVGMDDRRWAVEVRVFTHAHVSMITYRVDVYRSRPTGTSLLSLPLKGLHTQAGWAWWWQHAATGCTVLVCIMCTTVATSLILIFRTILLLMAWLMLQMGVSPVILLFQIITPSPLHWPVYTVIFAVLLLIYNSQHTFTYLRCIKKHL